MNSNSKWTELILLFVTTLMFHNLRCILLWTIPWQNTKFFLHQMLETAVFHFSPRLTEKCLWSLFVTCELDFHTTSPVLLPPLKPPHLLLTTQSQLSSPEIRYSKTPASCQPSEAHSPSQSFWDIECSTFPPSLWTFALQNFKWGFSLFLQLW